MGFINWLLAKPPTPPTQPAQGLARPGLVRSARPGTAAQAVSVPDAAHNVPAKPVLSAAQNERRIQRNARRDDLFQVVRESMVRAGVMSSTFKFKVLPLDQQGLGFLVMIDLAAEYGGETDKLNEVEALITRGAKNRHTIAVQGVYWRFYEHEKVHEARVTANTGPAPLFDLGANLRTQPQQAAAPLGAQPPAAPPRAQAPAAFARVPAPPPAAPVPEAAHLQTMGITANLAAARAQAQAAVAQQAAAKAANAAKVAVPMTASMAAIHNKLLLTGYESTEMVDPDEPAQGLSPTQYGDLR